MPTDIIILALAVFFILYNYNHVTIMWSLSYTSLLEKKKRNIKSRKIRNWKLKIIIKAWNILWQLLCILLIICCISHFLISQNLMYFLYLSYYFLAGLILSLKMSLLFLMVYKYISISIFLDLTNCIISSYLSSLGPSLYCNIFEYRLLTQVLSLISMQQVVQWLLLCCWSSYSLVLLTHIR